MMHASLVFFFFVTWFHSFHVSSHITLHRAQMSHVQDESMTQVWCYTVDQSFWERPSMETDSGQRVMSRPREGAKERRERRLIAEARIRLQLCRDAIRIASHRGGDGCLRARTGASTQTAPVDELPVTKYVAPACVASLVAPVPVPEDVASTVTLVMPDPVIEDVAPAPTVSFDPVIEYVESARGISHATPAPEIDDVTSAPSLSSTPPALLGVS